MGAPLPVEVLGIQDYKNLIPMVDKLTPGAVGLGLVKVVAAKEVKIHQMVIPVGILTIKEGVATLVGDDLVKDSFFLQLKEFFFTFCDMYT